MDTFGEFTIYDHWKLNFWKIREAGYSGMMLTERGNQECHYGIPYKETYIDLNSWDCESIVVWDLREIKIIEKGRIYEKNRH